MKVVTGYEEIADRAEKTVLNIVLAVFACVLFFGSCILTTANIQPKTSNDTPLIAVAGTVFSTAPDIFTVKKMIKEVTAAFSAPAGFRLLLQGARKPAFFSDQKWSDGK